ncbi:MAG TPA: glycosyltransferase family 4 protein [Dissulfurispiraceae bacterium]|nr:glycosyltransferase family 4 protein [Dissulfurispiraceae bacterium]
MKIALYEITSTISFGGIQTFVWGMAKALAAKGHTVHIYGGNGDIRASHHDNIKVFTFPYLDRQKLPDFGSRFKKFGERLSFNLFSLGALVKGHYDFIYVHKPYDLPVALFASKMSKARVVFGSGGTEFFPGYRYLAKKVDHFFACSEFNASQIKEYCGLMPHILHNGVSTELFRPLSPDMKIREGLHISDADSVVMSACRLVGWKGIYYAIKAVAELIGKGYSLKYLIAGDGEERGKLEALAKESNISDSVVFLGRMQNSELPLYYSLADIAVFPSVADETFGISIAEAMACGVPVVSTKVGGIPEVVAEGTGILVPPKDGHSLAEAIESLLTDRALLEKTGALARDWIVNSFSWESVSSTFETLLGCRI